MVGRRDPAAPVRTRSGLAAVVLGLSSVPLVVAYGLPAIIAGALAIHWGHKHERDLRLGCVSAMPMPLVRVARSAGLFAVIAGSVVFLVLVAGAAFFIFLTKAFDILGGNLIETNLP